MLSHKNTCIILIDLWGLSASQIDQVGPIYSAWIDTRQKIAELVLLANTYQIPVYLDNHGLPIPTQPLSLKEALLKSNVVINEKAFAEEGNASPFVKLLAMKGFNYLRSWWRNAERKSWIKNTINFEDYEHLVYAGYAMDACVAWSSRGKQEVKDGGKPCGYREVSNRHKKYLIKDAGLIQHVLYHGKPEKFWPEYSKVMKARGWDKPLAWKTARDLINETIYFCDHFASQFCTSLFLDELKITLGRSARTLIESLK